jgi:ribosome-binding protein aMBF1 (putative translation factor)
MKRDAALLRGTSHVIKAARQKSGMSQMDVAHAAKCQPSAVRRAERSDLAGNPGVSLHARIRIAQVLGVAPSELFSSKK